MKIHYFVVIVVLVLLVTGKVTNGISEDDQVLRLNKNYLNKNYNKNNLTSNKNNNINNNNNNNNNNKKNNGDNDDLFSQVTVDANSVITSTEIQGATPKSERNILKSSIKKYELSQIISSTTTPTAPSTSIESITKESLTINLNNVQSNILPTTSRPRHGPGASPQERDLPLMTLLAARRNALPRKEYRTPHRRITTTSRTSPSSTSVETTSSKSPTNSRSTCERNCTKNFTKRTTASCMRRCASLQRLANATTTTSPPSIKSKIDEKEKDNNEILLTDESSHGFFVVTKELNDTANHIQDGIKISQTSTEKSHRNKYKNYRNPSTATLSVEETDLQPYLFFGQKLPPPTVLRINKLNDDHPKILEITVTKPTERNRLSSRRYNSIRNIIGNSRRYNGIISNLTRTGNIVNTTNAPVDLLIKRNSQSILKDFPENVKDVIPSFSSDTIKQEKTSSTPSSAFLISVNRTTTTKVYKMITSTSAPITSSTEREKIAPLLINVPEEEETTEVPTAVPEPMPQQQTDNNFYIPPDHFEEKPNLIIFVNDTATTKSIKPISTTTTTQLPITTTTSTTTVRPSNTSEITLNKLPEAPVTTTPKSFTRTTVSSSVRSTVNPRVNPNANKAVVPTKLPDIIASPSTSINLNITSLYQPANTDNDDDDSNEIDPNISSTIPNVEIIVENNSVTIEAHRINMATYVLAGLGMFPIVVIILYVTKTILFKRRAKEETDLDGYVTDQQPISPVRQMDDDHNDDYSTISDNEFERKNIRFKSLLGEGNFGQVWKAEADDLSGYLGTTRIVAVKTVRSGGSQVSLKDEADIMRKLGSHTNVVTLLGTCIETEPHLLIMEYAMRGRLLSLLRAARSATNILPASVPGGRSLAPLSPRTLAGFALDISRGMEYISDKKIVHRDLAARNVLLDHNGVCKICDFGMSIDLESIRKTQIQATRKADLIRHNSNALENRMKFDFGGRIINQWNIHGFGNHNNNCNEKKHHDTISKRPALPIRWMAPEALQYHIFSTETDIWAFGIVLWEIATLGCTPYPNLSGREVVRNVPNGARPELPKDGRHEFYNLMSRCWIKNPQHRPSFREARSEISRSICKWVDDDTATSDYMDVSGFSEDLEHGMVYFNRRISEFECEI